MLGSSFIRAARPLALQARTQAPLIARRGYAEAASDRLKLSLVLPHETIFKSQDVVQVNLAAESGDMGILANHVPSIEALKPGVLEVIDGSDNKKWFVSGGFASMHPNNILTVNAVEAFPLDAFSPEAIRSSLAEAQKVAAGSGDEAEKAEAAIEVEVLEAIQAAIKA